MEKTAILSDCRKFRYSLNRRWADGPTVLFVMLNPSTADENEDDPTIGRCISFAKAWDYGSVIVGNLFAFRTPSPAVLMQAKDPIGKENDLYLGKLSNSADLTIAAWGNKGSFMGRGKQVATFLNNPHFLKLTKMNQPGHPLYLSGDLKPTPWVVT